MKNNSELITHLNGLNPGPFTLQGTNTYIIGTGNRRLLIDTGEGIPKYKDILQKEQQDHQFTIDIVLITHHHRDHVGGIQQILDLNPNAKIYKNLKHQLKEDAELEQKYNFHYFNLHNNQIFEGEGYIIEAIEQPGHCIDHYSFLLNNNIWFSGDCLLGGSSTLIDNLIHYLDSLGRIFKQRPQIEFIYPGHGHFFEDQQTSRKAIEQQIEHRLLREKQILAALNNDDNIDGILQKVYPNLDNPMVIMAAKRNIEVHLQKLIDENIVQKNQLNIYNKVI